MKLIFTLFLLIVAVTAEMTREEQDCRDQMGATDRDVDMFQNMEVPENRATKCYYACMMQILGYSDGHRFDRDGFLKAWLEAASDDKQRHIVRKIAERCDGTENADPCELAADIVACLRS